MLDRRQHTPRGIAATQAASGSRPGHGAARHDVPRPQAAAVVARSTPPPDPLAATLARAVRRRAFATAERPHVAVARAPAVAIAARPSGPTLARAFRARDFKRPSFTTATYRMAAESHNLLRGAAIDPYAANLASRNLAVPHRFSWKSIRDNTLLYLNGVEDESDFRRWTDRMVHDGYDGKRRQFRRLQALLTRKRDKRLKKYFGPDDVTDRLDDQIAACRRILRHMSRSQDDLRDARRRLVARVEDGASRGRVIAAAADFFKLMNNFFPNVPDLGPHRGVNIQVRERMHLNVQPSGSMSPFSSSMVEMSPHRSDGIAVDDEGWVVGTFGDVVDPGWMDSDIAAGIHAHGTFIVNNRDEPFTWT